MSNGAHECNFPADEQTEPTDYSKDIRICKYYVSHRGEPTYEYGCVANKFIPQSVCLEKTCAICGRKIMIFDKKQEEPTHKIVKERWND